MGEVVSENTLLTLYAICMEDAKFCMWNKRWVHTPIIHEHVNIELDVDTPHMACGMPYDRACVCCPIKVLTVKT